MYCDLLSAAIDWPPMGRAGSAVGDEALVAARAMVLLPTTTCVVEGARLIAVPDTLIAEEPARSV